ncbi:NADH-dependent flavin oxidoreductase [Bisgaard Taxon 10/6]|uniref:NADH-dependent flavin oxidoreductase n=1 Tax=Exercitatus varius TaxID=67857 RepID=A0ABT6EQN9_9PAST|nr:NADH-dependent flavin oxidoreductase [Exercitatus varius]QOF68469.1 NADH-dependent flavin oxidoreductase [Actinobacillus sp. GY-402]MDG2918456.1 NADH-dependent flavin oxidoreductase [Exercitatus varius]MDG2938966.1 NADH-dependent flavin oxidoreductase [Exercitatus varius]MDG2941305.1 NADH-dependent flavin oxidoreductase [Exercitatus varius]MDG2945836.1 NADH-dependent flavin oxidoreductase [Exercitatus varius]
MNPKFKRLFETVTFPNGATINSRFAMGPMVVVGSQLNGEIGDDDLAYWERRNDSGSLLITGATAVSEYSDAYGNGLKLHQDELLNGWKKLANIMKAKGNRAIVQLFHAGYRANFTYKDKGVAYSASTKEYPFLDYPVTGMTESQIKTTLDEFAAAAKRVIEAGFDGIEIHGANRYLIHQFFSSVSNIRDDQWGGSLANRARFALEVVKRIQAVIKEHAKPDFILGYRISPEEIHREGNGFTFDEALYLINQIAQIGVDYFNVSQSGVRSFAASAKAGIYMGQPINQIIKTQLNGRALLLASGDLTHPDKILEAVMDYADIASSATMVLIDPDTKNKIQSGHENDVSLAIDETTIDDLKLPKEFYKIAPMVVTSELIPQKTKDLIYKK